MENTLNFRISSALKDLIGRDLITDQYIAVFELVKNGFDAHANKVEIIFEGETKPERLIIQDNGKGMSYKDIIEKWMFVAYSAKKEGTEDDDIDLSKRQGFQNLIYENKRKYAGAKGVGRFSCDRLGSNLTLVTSPKFLGGEINQIQVDWRGFEGNSKVEFVEIPITHKKVCDYEYKYQSGTRLIIENLRDDWNLESLRSLRDSLGKLVNPFRTKEDSEFNILLDIRIRDLRTFETRTKEIEQLSGEINNNVFEIIEPVVTSIKAEIDESGNNVTYSLRDKGLSVYRVVEKNQYEKLSQININIHYLNQKAKTRFHKYMKIRSVDYGSVFLYKNGFRVYPFGEPGDDYLGIDKRKAQGYNRFLGAREIIGVIEIGSDSPDFKESTSRDGGLIKTESYNQLVKLVFEIIRKLEKYVVEFIRWGSDKFENGILIEPEATIRDKNVQIEIEDFIKKLSDSKSILSVEYEDDFLEILESRNKDSDVKKFDKIIENVQKSNLDEATKLTSELKKEYKDIVETQKDSNEKLHQAHMEGLIKQEKIEALKKKHDELTTQNFFLEKVQETEKTELIGIQHTINHSSSRIKEDLKELLEITESLDRKDVFELLSKISFEINKIFLISQYANKAKFNLLSKKITQNIVAFISEYVQNVHKKTQYYLLDTQHKLKVIEIEGVQEFITKFSSLDLVAMLENFISNSEKAGASKLLVQFVCKDEKLFINIIDNGSGIREEDTASIFNLGYTTTNGTGIGLYHNKQIAKRHGWELYLDNNYKQGACFVVEVIK